ncbi:hypothetical protein HPB47_006049 [Ixodes persulcatus]|uniref:Uncharacterized protein n=1 Tax=Ixodes persulcatus TaxID=34615 RepID=A0AC60PBJ3_IXOPE|nr:hypothetical protein HPB47_006049 [Ixodes persulcatus]
MKPGPVIKPNPDERPKPAARPSPVVEPNPAVRLSPTGKLNPTEKPSSAVKPTPVVKPRKRSLSTVVRRSRFKLQKTYAIPSTPADVSASPNAAGKTSSAATRGPPSRPVRRSLFPFKVGSVGRYVYRKSNVSVASPHRFVSTANKPGGRSIPPRTLVSKYKLVRDKTKVLTPSRSLVTNLACLGARRIVKKYKINNVNRTRSSLSHSRGQSGSSRQQRILVIRGTTYHMDVSGKVLRRAPTSSQSPGASLSRIDIGGKTFVERLPGVLSQTPSSETRTYLSRTINRSIHRMRTVNTRKLERRSDRYCMFFNRFGRCNKGASCTYIHDPEKIAVCTRQVIFLLEFLRGTCKLSDCPFSHKVAPEKMPVCSFFLKGRCTSNPCPYRHVKVNAKAEVCRDFAVRGFCTEGIKCKRQHVLVCPEYAANKKCPRGNRCFLAHRDPAAKRKHCEKSASPVDLEQSGPERDENPPGLPFMRGSKVSVACC